ncbi:peroxiredoxin [Jatrophihabitans sp. YIM 134969]
MTAAPADTAAVVGPNVGDLAPDFSLRDQNNEIVTLSEYRGEKAVLVVFYPLAFTGICSGELTGIQVAIDAFSTPAVQVVTVSVDSVPTHRVFADQYGFEFPLLADFWPHGAVASAYGCFDDTAGIATRGTFLVDRDGVIRFVERYGAGHSRDPRAWLDAVDALA